MSSNAHARNENDQAADDAAKLAKLDAQVSAELAQIEEDRAKSRSRSVSLKSPGEINKELALALQELVTPEEVGATIRSLMNATRMSGRKEVPDQRAREAGCKLWLAYRVGLPVQRQEVVTASLDATTSAGLEDRLRHSPQLRSRFKQIIAEIETEMRQVYGPVVSE